MRTVISKQTLTNSQKCATGTREGSYAFSLKRYRSFQNSNQTKQEAKSCTVKKKPHFKKLTHSAPSEKFITLERVHKIAESITQKFSEFGEMMSKLDDIQNKRVKQYTCLFLSANTNAGPLRNHSKQTQ